MGGGAKTKTSRLPVKQNRMGEMMAHNPNEAASIEELLVSSFAQTDALAQLLIEKGIITQQEFFAKISEERATYQAMFKPTAH